MIQCPVISTHGTHANCPSTTVKDSPPDDIITRGSRVDLHLEQSFHLHILYFCSRCPTRTPDQDTSGASCISTHGARVKSAHTGRPEDKCPGISTHGAHIKSAYVDLSNFMSIYISTHGTHVKRV